MQVGCCRLSHRGHVHVSRCCWRGEHCCACALWAAHLLLSGRPSACKASMLLTDLQVSGLKSITAKHLALSCQCLSALITLHPVLSLVLMALVQQPRLGLLQPEFDRVLQVCVLPMLDAPTQLCIQCSLPAVHVALAAMSTTLCPLVLAHGRVQASSHQQHASGAD